jgi:hypothetical protein
VRRPEYQLARDGRAPSEADEAVGRRRMRHMRDVCLIALAAAAVRTWPFWSLPGQRSAAGATASSAPAAGVTADQIMVPTALISSPLRRNFLAAATAAPVFSSVIVVPPSPLALHSGIAAFATPRGWRAAVPSFWRRAGRTGPPAGCPICPASPVTVFRPGPVSHRGVWTPGRASPSRPGRATGRAALPRLPAAAAFASL